MAGGYLQTKTSHSYGSKFWGDGRQTILTVHSGLSLWLAAGGNDMKVEKLTPAMEHRKNSKPLMEKKRRARINACLSQLKHLVLQAVRKDGCSYTKLEKADILEMTVQYLRGVQRQHFMSAASFDPSVINKYLAGYSECSSEVIRYVSTLEGVDSDLRARLLQHMASGVQGLAALQVMAYFPSNQQGCSSHVTGRYTQSEIGQLRRVSAQMMTSRRLELSQSSTRPTECGTDLQSVRISDRQNPSGHLPPPHAIRPQYIAGQEGTFALVPKVLPSGQVTTVLVKSGNDVSGTGTAHLDGHPRVSSPQSESTLVKFDREHYDIPHTEDPINLSKKRDTEFVETVRSDYGSGSDSSDEEDLHVGSNPAHIAERPDSEVVELREQHCRAPEPEMDLERHAFGGFETQEPLWRPW